MHTQTSILFLFILFLLSPGLKAQNITFEPINSGFQGALFGNLEFADVDNDGDQDVLVCGRVNGWQSSDSTSLYINDGTGNFTEINHPFPNVQDATTAFADVDNDGDQDLVISGSGDYPLIHADLYINDGSGNFTLNNSTPFTPHTSGEIAFADVDNDGDQDVFMSGNDGDGESFSSLYINENGNFAESNNQFDFDHNGPIAFADLDGDSDIDLLRVTTSTDGKMTLIYNNNGAGNFTLSQTSLPGYNESAIAVGDIDSDGDNDVMLSGENSNIASTQLFLNQGNGEFSEFSDEDLFPDYSIGKNAFADFDNDGDLDIFMIGTLDGGADGITSSIFENKGNNDYLLSDSNFGAYIARIDIADIDGDNLLDVIIGGTTVGNPNFATWLFLNKSIVDIKEIDEIKLEVNYFPNPTSDRISFQSVKKIESIILFNTAGQIVHSTTPNSEEFTISTNELQKGIYIAKLITKKGECRSLLISKI